MPVIIYDIRLLLLYYSDRRYPKRINQLLEVFKHLLSTIKSKKHIL